MRYRHDDDAPGRWHKRRGWAGWMRQNQISGIGNPHQVDAFGLYQVHYDSWASIFSQFPLFDSFILHFLFVFFQFRGFLFVHFLTQELEPRCNVFGDVHGQAWL